MSLNEIGSYDLYYKHYYKLYYKPYDIILYIIYDIADKPPMTSCRWFLFIKNGYKKRIVPIPSAKLLLKANNLYQTIDYIPFSN